MSNFAVSRFTQNGKLARAAAEDAEACDSMQSNDDVSAAAADKSFLAKNQVVSINESARALSVPKGSERVERV